MPVQRVLQRNNLPESGIPNGDSSHALAIHATFLDGPRAGPQDAIQQEAAMQDYLIWTILGFVLIIVEMVTGTFYLLVLGVGAFAGALAAWLGAPFLVQVATGGLVSVVGTWLVFRWHAKQQKTNDPGNALDVGQTVTLVRWVNQADGTMRVKYRGAEWEARVKPGDLASSSLQEGAFLYILAQDGSMLVVASQRPVA